MYGDDISCKGAPFTLLVLSNDQMVTLLPSDENRFQSLGGVAGDPVIRYERPAECSKKEKCVLLLRAGHNAVVDCRDAGLTNVGIQQIEAASEWLCLFFKVRKCKNCFNFVKFECLQAFQCIAKK